MSGDRTRSVVFGAALDLQEFCEQRGWRFCFIGGIAVERWSVPRFTEDADMTLVTGFLDHADYSRTLLERFEGRCPDALEFAIQHRVLLLRHENGVELDVGLGGMDFEVRAIDRASYWEARPGVRLLTCSADDLVVHKAFASRLQDWADVERIIGVQEAKLNVPQILRELAPLAELKEDDGIIRKLEHMLKKRGLL
jgi:hypothetical protein